MLSNSELYHVWRKRLAELSPDGCESRLVNMVMLVIGLFEARSVHVSLIARKLPIRAKKLSLDKRLRQFLDNGAVRVREWYRPVAVGLLRAASSAGQVHLVIDSSKVGFGHQLLMVSIAYHRRALPLTWTWVRCRKGHSTTGKQPALLSYVRSLLPGGVKVSLVGDSEFGNLMLIKHVCWWKWEYALRQPGDHLVMPYGKTEWQRLDSFGLKPGYVIWLGRTLLTRANPCPTHLALYWQPGQPEPWYLATNLPSPHSAIRLYRRPHVD